MSNEVLFLIKKHTDTLIDETKTKPRETLEFNSIEQMETCSFNPPVNFSEEGKWWLGVTRLEPTNSVSNHTDKKKFLKFNTRPLPFYTRCRNYEQTT